MGNMGSSENGAVFAVFQGHSGLTAENGSQWGPVRCSSEETLVISKQKQVVMWLGEGTAEMVRKAQILFNFEVEPRSSDQQMPVILYTVKKRKGNADK